MMRGLGWVRTCRLETLKALAVHTDGYYSRRFQPISATVVDEIGRTVAEIGRKRRSIDYSRQCGQGFRRLQPAVADPA